MQSLKIKAILRYLVLIFTIIPVVIIGVIGFFSVTGFANSTVEQYAKSIATAHSDAIDQVIGQYERDAHILSLRQDVYDMASSSANEESVGLVKNTFDTIINRQEEDVLNFVIVDRVGNVVYDHKNKQEKGQYFFGYQEMQNISTGQSFLSSIYSGSEYGYDNSVFFIARHTQFTKHSTAVAPNGFIIEIISTSRISRLLQSSKYEGSYVAVTDGKDSVIGYDGGSVRKIDSTDLKDVLLSTEKNTVNTPIRYSESGKTGYFGRFTGVSGTNWKWVSVTDSGTPLAKVLIPLAISIGAMVILALVCIFIGFALTNSIVSPMKVMINDMREIKEGNREKRSEINARNELKDMSLTFNGLLDEVCLSEELHKTISDISDNMLFEWDFSKERMYVSDNFTEKFDINPAESQLANGKFLDKMMNEQHADQYKRDISSMLKNRTGHSGEYQMTTRNGSVVWFTVRAQCITDRLGEPLRVVGVVTDIDSEKKLELQLSERASYDFLSQLYNRSTFEKELQSEIERSAHSRVGLMFIDVDDFKFINDRFGHSVGDEVIRYVASSIKTRVKGTGFAGRFGGDEFVLCITDPAQIKDIENLALDLIDELYTGYRSELANVSINIKASVGIAFAPEHGENGKQIVAAADEAMYFVKKNGKANYHIYQPEDSQMEDLQHTL